MSIIVKLKFTDDWGLAFVLWGLTCYRLVNERERVKAAEIRDGQKKGASVVLGESSPLLDTWESLGSKLI